MDALKAVAAVGEAIAKVEEHQTQRDAESNTPEMRAAALMQRLGEIVDQHREHIKTHNLAAYRQDVAAPAAGSVLKP